ncbi:MAG: M50 family metallopeptidase, partial [Acidobacteriota bacterium]
VMTQPGIPLTFVVSRQNETLEVVVTPEEREGRGFIGIWAYPRVQKKYGFFRSMRESLRVNLESSGLLFTTLGKLFGRKLSLRTLSGPVDIYRFSGATYRQGLVPFLSFMAMVSLQLGIINLLPIPILDGGHIFILGLEGIIRRDLSMRFKERVIQVGFVFLLVFMGVVIYLDVEKNNLLGWLWKIF